MAAICYWSILKFLPNPFPKPIEILRWIPHYPIGSDWFSSCNSALTLRALKMSKIKNLKQSNFSQSVFFRVQNALCGKTGETIIGLRVSKQDGMISSLSPICLSLVRVNPPIPTQLWCRNQKIWGKRISSLKSTGKWKSHIMDWCVLSYDLQSAYRCYVTEKGHISPQQNHALMKKMSKKCRALGLHSSQGVDKRLHGRDRHCL